MQDGALLMIFSSHYLIINIKLSHDICGAQKILKKITKYDFLLEQ
jgi:hypothetical protein